MNYREQKFCRLLRIPLVTLCCVSLCCTLFLVDFHRLSGSKLKHLCLSSHAIVRFGEVYRIFTHIFFHKGPWHLLVTMLPMLVLGTMIECKLGSILFFLIVNACWITSVVLEVSMATMLYHIFHDMFHGCSLGFSGIVFGLMVIMTKVNGMQECGIGIFKIPFSVFPWVCLVIYYFGFHRGSVFLHIGGIIAGYAYKYGAFTCCLPYPERLAQLEHSDWMQFIIHVPCFVRFSQPDLIIHFPVSVTNDQYNENGCGESGLMDV